MNIPSTHFVVGTTALLMLMVICVSGCNKKSDVISNRIKKYSSSEGISEQIFDETENTITLSHDFGVIVQPIDDALTHEYEITNNTDVVWTLKQIVNTCSCTVADMTSNKIQPGKTEKVLLAYKPVGEGAFEDSRKSLIIFEEEKAPKFILVVGARVREPMTVRPKSLAWTRVGTGQTKNDNFEIQNFSDEEWKTFEIASKPQWLGIELKSVSPPDTEPMMRQLWLADTVADTMNLTPGEHRDEIVLSATSSNGETITQKCPVVLRVTSAVSAVPAQFFFGNVKPNETAIKSIKVFFSPDSIPKDKSEIHFGHIDSLKLEWLNVEGESWELEATLDVTNIGIPDDLTVVMTFDDPALPKIYLPVYVMMSTESQL